MSDVFQRCHERRKAKLLSRHRITDWPKVRHFVLSNDMYLFQFPVQKYDLFPGSWNRRSSHFCTICTSPIPKTLSISRRRRTSRKRASLDRVMDLERDALVVAGKEGRMRKDEGLWGLQKVSDVLRKKMCIITGNTVLLSAHLSSEGRRYRTHQRRNGHVKTAKICRILRHTASLTIHSVPHILSSVLRFSQNPFSLGFNPRYSVMAISQQGGGLPSQ